jgi:4-diphosphocytidyl-2C-methyl-D-erythritol kinase
VISELANDLEPAAEAVEPRLVEFRETLEELVGVPALLAGSGSAYVVPVPDDKVGRIEAVAKKVRRTMRVPVAQASTVKRGVRVSSG